MCAVRACMQCLVRIPLDIGTTLFYMCPHTVLYVSSYCYVRVLTPYCSMCPHTAIYVSSYCYVCSSDKRMRCLPTLCFASAPQRLRLCLWHASSVLAALPGNDGSPGPHTTRSLTHTLTHSPTPDSLTALMTE
jgi:hypothetical protein